MNATERLGAFVARCVDEPLAPAVAQRAAACLLDVLALTLMAREERTFRAMRAAVTPVPRSPGTARVWADGTSVVLSEAITANALGAHAHFHDDSDHPSWSHPGSLIVPLAVSLGEANGSPLAAVLRSIAAGYATLQWMGADEAVARPLIARGIRTTPTLGTIGAAATAAVGLGLDRAQAINAMAMSACITGGILEPVRCGSDEWRAHAAQAARGGLLAAQLARGGAVGAPDALEGPKGFLRALAGLEETPPRWAHDPDPAAILHAIAKPWAALGDNCPAVAAAGLVRRGVDPQQIKRVTIKIWRPYSEYPGTAFAGPFERTVQALASTTFCVAAMLAHGRLEYDIPEQHRQDEEILRLVRASVVEPHDETHMDASVVLELADGTRHERATKEAPQTIFFHDRATAVALFDQRLAGCGFAAGRGEEIASAVFEAAAGRTAIALAELLDRIDVQRR
jgi:2-methylcitrate dehydratase PrpD